MKQIPRTLSHQEIEEGIRPFLDSGYGCEAAYWAAYHGGLTPFGVGLDDAITRAALGGLRDRERGVPYAFAYCDYV